MSSQEKWVQLFEQVIGRKPSPQEFMEGKAGGFDLKQIQTIAHGNLAAEPTTTPTPEPIFSAGDSLAESARSVGTEGVVGPVLAESVQPAPAFSVPVARDAKKKWLWIALAILGLGGAGGFYYMHSITGVDVAAEAFATAVKSNDYAQIAELLSQNDQKWNKEEAREFINYLIEADVDIVKEVQTIAETDGKNTYHDQNGNKLLGMAVKRKRYGLFPEYQVVSYPVEVYAQTDAKDLKVGDKSLKSGEKILLGETKFVPVSYAVVGKTPIGDVDTSVMTDLNQAKDNQIQLSLMTADYSLDVRLPEGLPQVTDPVLFVNKKEVAKSLTADLKLLENQEIAVHARFNYEGTSYETEMETLVVPVGQNQLEVALDLSKEVEEKLASAQKAKKDKEEQARKDAEARTRIESFMQDYINAMRSSISSRSNRFAPFYDTSSEAYRVMNDYVEGGGVARANIDYQTTIDYTVTDVKKEGNDYIVTVHNQFREVYINGRSSMVEKNQVFKLRPNGSSYLIYEISEY